MPSAAHPVMTRAQLNRAALHRQLLLERAADLDVATALERIGGVQAQEPASPFIGLWSRLARFDGSALRRAFAEREAVKTSLMRITLHAVSARDYPAFQTALLPMLRATGSARRGSPRPSGIEELADAAAAFAAVPRRNTELRDFLAARLGSSATFDTPVWWWVRRHLPLVHVPEPDGWAFGRRPVLVTAATWLDDARLADGSARPLPEARVQLVRRYLGAFGPASSADLSAWSGASVSDFREAIASLDAAGELVRFTDEQGRTLLDLAEAPRPAPDVPAPPRLLPMWDSILLAYRDRTRVISDEARARVVGRNGDVLPTFLVDGRVAGFWWAEPDGSGTRIVIEPFGRLARDTRRALEDEAAGLATFVGPVEPGVYARYRTSGARRR